MCWICALCRRVLRPAQSPPPVDHEMVRLAVEFRSQRANETADLFDARAEERDSYVRAKEQLVHMRAKRAELERHMLRQGIELPPDAADE